MWGIPACGAASGIPSPSSSSSFDICALGKAQLLPGVTWELFGSRDTKILEGGWWEGGWVFWERGKIPGNLPKDGNKKDQELFGNWLLLREGENPPGRRKIHSGKRKSPLWERKILLGEGKSVLRGGKSILGKGKSFWERENPFWEKEKSFMGKENPF